jgi:predicted chitinase
MTITIEQLNSIMPHAPQVKLPVYFPALVQAMAEFEITTPLREAAFLAQLAHESVELKAFEEYSTGAEYENRSDLGNTHPGDGVRYKGRGPIQLTGRKNYRAAGAALGVDLEGSPEQAADPHVAFRVAGWFWKSHGLNPFADGGPGNFDAITRKINGGLNGKAQRDHYYAKAREVLGC